MRALYIPNEVTIEMDEKFEIEVMMDSGQIFTFLVGHAQVCRDGRAHTYLEKSVARKRAKKRNIPGRVMSVTNLTVKSHQSRAKLSDPWWNK